ncbi:MAG TPA: TetR/AcrR family transcriptional regulator [Solirubrobacteraceae bacterium]|nr:TetR/AcrR family transcriptional regulator [Solirubrobacteraceae bacterium]
MPGQGAIHAAWGRGERPGRGPRPGLSVTAIAQAGAKVAREEGLAAVSMARVAKEVGASTMALYRYVASKDELLALMVDAALGPPVPVAPKEGWRAGLSRWAWSQHERLAADRWAVAVPISGPPLTPNAVAWLEDGLWALRETCLPEEDKASVVLLLSGYVRGEAALVADLGAAEFDGDEMMLAYSGMLRALIVGDRFPALNALLDAGVFDKADHPDREFAFGLERLLDGIQALVDRQR